MSMGFDDLANYKMAFRPPTYLLLKLGLDRTDLDFDLPLSGFPLEPVVGEICVAIRNSPFILSNSCWPGFGFSAMSFCSPCKYG